jgi:hypothetical protein
MRAAIHGDDESQRSLRCESCNRLLVEGVPREAIRGLGIECPNCRGLLGFRECGPGEPIVPLSTIVLLPMELELTEPIELVHSSWAIIDREAAERYAIETGSLVPWTTLGELPQGLSKDLFTGLSLEARPPRVHDPPLSADTVRTVEAKLSAMTGISRVAAANPAWARRPDPVSDLLVALEQAKVALSSDSLVLDHARLVQAICDVELTQRWSRHPAHPSLESAMKDPRNYRHNISTLYVASYLADCGNGVTLVAPTNQPGCIPDLLVSVEEPGSSMAIELKAPGAIDYPSGPLSGRMAKTVIRSSVRRALGQGGKPGQISPSRPGLLVVAGFGLLDQDIERLREAATRAARKLDPSKGVRGIGIASFGTVRNELPMRGGITPILKGDSVRSVQVLSWHMLPEFEDRIYLYQQRVDINRALPSAGS